VRAHVPGAARRARARALRTSAVVTSASTVGLPRESKIMRATTAVMIDDDILQDVRRCAMRRVRVCACRRRDVASGVAGAEGRGLRRAGQRPRGPAGGPPGRASP
jgi:hypothetical protein